MESSFEVSEKEYLSILELAFEVAQALSETTSPNGRIPDCQYLAIKLFAHAASAHWLFKGTKSTVPTSTGGASFIDFSSTTVLARAALETYLRFFEVFVSTSDDDDEFEFEYCLWHLAGQVVLEGMVPDDPSLITVHEDAMKEIASLRNRLRATQKFQSLGQGKQTDVLKGIRRREWKQVAESTGFGHSFIRRIYRYYSGFVHADGYTSGQIMSAQSKEAQQLHAKTDLATIMMVLSKFILDYGKLFDEARAVFPKFPEAHKSAETWSEVASIMS